MRMTPNHPVMFSQVINHSLRDARMGLLGKYDVNVKAFPG